MSNLIDYVKKPTVATLFAGCGGDSLGFSNAGFDLVFANDNNPDACDTLRRRFEEPRNKNIVKRGNIEKIFDFKSANVISGGFPCQGFSLAGSRNVDDKRNSLYSYLKRAISTVNPEFFLAENVKGFITLGEHGKTKYFQDGKIIQLGSVAQSIIDELSKVGRGYKVKYELHNAKDFGLPQDRERIIIVGVRNDLDFDFEFPVATHGGLGKKPYTTIEKAIKQIPTRSKEVHNEYFSTRYMSRNRIRKWNDVSFTIPAEAAQVTLHPNSRPMIPVTSGLFWECSKNQSQLPKFEQKWNLWKQRYDAFIKNPTCKKHLKLFRVRDKRTFSGNESTCATWKKSQSYKGYASTWDIPEKKPNRLSWRQCAAIQGFPSDYPFQGDVVSIYRQIGNAVPPPLIEAIAKNIMPFFKGKNRST